MSTASKRYSDQPHREDLQNGDRMTQSEFHRIYETMPPEFRAELIGGIVHVPSPLKLPHAVCHPHLAAVLVAYKGNTPGVQVGDNGSVILSDQDEVQPDLFLRVLPDFGGQSTTSPDEYLVGAPELVAEIANSTRSIDLHSKKERYALAGVVEYVVVCLRPLQIQWFCLQDKTAIELGTDGIYRSIVFPGLWIDPNALFQSNYLQLMDVLNQGLRSPEYLAFKEMLLD